MVEQSQKKPVLGSPIPVLRIQVKPGPDPAMAKGEGTLKMNVMRVAYLLK